MLQAIKLSSDSEHFADGAIGRCFDIDEPQKMNEAIDYMFGIYRNSPPGPNLLFQSGVLVQWALEGKPGVRDAPKQLYPCIRHSGFFPIPEAYWPEPAAKGPVGYVLRCDL